MFLLVCSASAVEEKLRNNIMKDYNKKARPVIKETDMVHIFIDIALLQLMKVVSEKFYCGLPLFRDILLMSIKVIWFCVNKSCSVVLPEKNCATLSTNQIQTLKQFEIAHSRFPVLVVVVVYMIYLRIWIVIGFSWSSLSCDELLRDNKSCACYLDCYD